MHQYGMTMSSVIFINKMDKEQKKQHMKEYRENNKDKIKEYYKNNKDKIKEYQEKNKDKIKEYRLISKYNMTANDFENMLKEQNNICPICNETLSIADTNGKRIVVDHCHKSGNVRGLIHSNCNSLLGFSEDKQHRLLNAQKYLERHEHETQNVTTNK